MDKIMTPNNLIEELRDRFKITILELRRKLPEYEIKMYCDALGITEQTLSWAIENWKPRKELKKQEKSTSKIYPFTIFKKINFLEINYTIDDFFKDYNNNYSNYKERVMTYNMVMAGYSITQLKDAFNLESQFYYQITKGFNYNSMSLNIHRVFDILGINVDISPFTVDLYKTHIELFGKKEDLENFKNRYSIKWEL